MKDIGGKLSKEDLKGSGNKMVVRLKKKTSDPTDKMRTEPDLIRQNDELPEQKATKIPIFYNNFKNEAPLPDLKLSIIEQA